MGGHPYWYFVPYNKDPQAALDDLREREFKAGRYNPVLPFIDFEEPAFSAQKPGPKHRTIKKAVEASAEEGTRSILDITSISPTSEYCAATPVAGEVLRNLYDTDKPTHEMLVAKMDFLHEIERGKCVYLTVYKDKKPSELLFAGYSYD
jgi:hypothetical protein